MVQAPGVRVDVVDDDPDYAQAIARILRLNGYQATAFASAETFLSRPGPEATACLVLDLQMPGLGGAGLQAALARTDPLLPIVFVSGTGDVQSAVRAMRGGAVDFLSKPFEAAQLVDAVKRALAQGALERTAHEERAAARARLARLTPSEREVVEYVARGLLNKQIASELGKSEHTVKLHRGNAVEKLGVDSVAELVRLVDLARAS
jgi:FixJ family two-component response regulator